MSFFLKETGNVYSKFFNDNPPISRRKKIYGVFVSNNNRRFLGIKS